MRHVIVGLAVLIACALAPTALGKGASEATIAGPGLDGPISLAGEGDPNGGLLAAIADQGGFFPAVFVQTPDPMLDTRPAGELGPLYTVTYVMPGPDNEADTLVQSVYPYASPSPVTHVEPGQAYWTTERTRGGWYVASPELRELLVSAGLPESAPIADAGPSDSPWRVVGPLAVFLAIGTAAVVAAAVMAKRRPQVV